MSSDENSRELTLSIEGRYQLTVKVTVFSNPKVGGPPPPRNRSRPGDGWASCAVTEDTIVEIEWTLGGAPAASNVQVGAVRPQ